MHVCKKLCRVVVRICPGFTLLAPKRPGTSFAVAFHACEISVIKLPIAMPALSYNVPKQAKPIAPIVAPDVNAELPLVGRRGSLRPA